MAIRIDGYFDRNFGDDYMIKTVAEHFKDEDFVISPSDGISDMLQNVPNIRISNEECERVIRITGSGFMINSQKAFITEAIWLLKGKKEADWCIGCNIEPFKNVLCELVIKKKLKKYSFITCRDKKSYEWFLKKCKDVRVEFFPDILFSAPVKRAEGGTALGISVMNLGFDGTYEVYYSSLAAAADYYMDQKKGEVILFAFDTGCEDDTAACNYVRSLMKNKDVKIVAHNRDGEIVQAFDRCGKIIGTRFHSIVLALKMGIDVYPVIFREKAKNLLDDVNYPIEGRRVEILKEDELKEFINAEPLGFSIDGEYEKRAEGHVKMLEMLLKN